MLTRNQNNMVEILLQLKGLVEGPSYRQPYTTNMSELQSEEFAAQRRNQQG